MKGVSCGKQISTHLQAFISGEVKTNTADSSQVTQTKLPIHIRLVLFFFEVLAGEPELKPQRWTVYDTQRFLSSISLQPWRAVEVMWHKLMDN